MTTLEFYIALSSIWLAITWLPYILDRVFVRGLPQALANYSPDAKPQSGWAQRAMRAHTVAVESFVAFAPLAIMAMIRTPEDTYPGILAASYFFALFAHYWIYLFGIPVLRTLSFVVVVLSTVGLGLRVLGII